MGVAPLRLPEITAVGMCNHPLPVEKRRRPCSYRRLQLRAGQLVRGFGVTRWRAPGRKAPKTK